MRLAALIACVALLSVSPLDSQSPPESAPPAARDFSVFERTILELQAAMEARVVSSQDLVTLYAARIRAYDQDGPRINAMIALNPHATDAAAALDEERRLRGPRGPLHGIPIVIKDNFETADMPTTSGSLALAGFVTGRDAFQVRRLRDAGAVIVGKTNMHEFAAGITTISSLGGQTRNPYDLQRNPGGSSGGTGAAVAANFAAAGMGADTCGSIRIPAASNNLYGLRPTFGLSSRDGVIPLSHSQDVAGPLARTVTDLAIMLDATVGPDPRDATTRAGDGHIPRSYRDALDRRGLAGARIGILNTLFGTAPEDAEVTAIVRRAIERMREQGAEVVDIDVPKLEEMLQGSSVIDAEFKFDLIDYLAQYPGAPVKSIADILESGRYHPSLEAGLRRRNAIEARDTDAYRHALAKRSAVQQAVVSAMAANRLAALAYPVLRRKPALIGQPQAGSNCQLSASTGLPAMSAPAGFTSDGLPIGVEVLGGLFSEPELLKLAYAYEEAVRPRRPPATTPPLADERSRTP